MKKFLLFFGFIALCLTKPALAQIEFDEIKSRSYEKISITGFDDYYPFGQFESNSYSGVLKDFIEEFCQLGKYIIEYLPTHEGYEQMIRTSSKGKGADVILGMYSETSLYDELKYIYPAAIDNPINIVMLPSRMTEVKSVESLKKLKGAIHKKERISDDIKNYLKSFNVEYVDNSEDLYAKLLKGEVDYVLTSIYFGRIEISKLGIRDYVAISKQSIFTMPLFIGISKFSPHRDFMVHNLSRMLEKPEMQEKIKNNMLEIIQQIEKNNAGIVPKTYIIQ